MTPLNSVYQKNPDIVSRKIADEVILVPIKRKLASINAMYLLRDDVSIRIWELIDGQRSAQQIRNIICKEFKVDSKQAEGDIIKFLEQLEKIEAIIIEVSGRSPMPK